MMQPIRLQAAPTDLAAPSVLVEGRAVALLGSDAETVAAPNILVEGRPLAVVSSPNGRGSTTVLGARDSK